MKAADALQLTAEMRDFSKERELGLLIVGSTGYRSAFLHSEAFALCDDLDCIFVYERIPQLEGIPYLRDEFVRTAGDMTEQGKADMFSTKFVRNGIQVSADFISMSYLEGILADCPAGTSTYRNKLTDAVEKSENTYCNIRGENAVYQKPCEEYGDYRIYRLPIHWYYNGEYYPGVLLNKFLYNPFAGNISPKQDALIKGIQANIYDYCSKVEDNTDRKRRLFNTAYKRSEFSEETQYFLMSMKGGSI